MGTLADRIEDIRHTKIITGTKSTIAPDLVQLDVVVVPKKNFDVKIFSSEQQQHPGE